MSIGGFFKGLFGGRNDEVIITREQAQEFRRLVQKELSEIAHKRHDLVDKGALEGKTVPVCTLYSSGNSAAPEDRAEILKVTEMLLDRHGETMPVNTAHRFVLFLGDGENEERACGVRRQVATRGTCGVETEVPCSRFQGRL